MYKLIIHDIIFLIILYYVGVLCIHDRCILILCVYIRSDMIRFEHILWVGVTTPLHMYKYLSGYMS